MEVGVPGASIRNGIPELKPDGQSSKFLFLSRRYAPNGH